MIIKWRKTALRLRSKFIRNAIAMIGMTAMISACGSGTGKDNNVNQDSLDQMKEQERLDSIAYADSVAAAEKDTVVLDDTISNNIITPPVNTDPAVIQTKYGVVPDFNENDRPATRYGVRYN